MKMSGPSQQIDLLPMELPSMSLQEVFHAKTCRSLENERVLRESVAAFGLKSSDLLASYDHNTSSWRTLQTCLMALVNGQEHGLGEFSVTWPNAGMMQNGRIFPRRPWALPIAESASGLLPTPRKSLGDFYKIVKRADFKGNLEEMIGELGYSGVLNPTFVEMMMGFPPSHTDLPPSETP